MKISYPSSAEGVPVQTLCLHMTDSKSDFEELGGNIMVDDIRNHLMQGHGSFIQESPMINRAAARVDEHKEFWRRFENGLSQSGMDDECHRTSARERASSGWLYHQAGRFSTGISEER